MISGIWLVLRRCHYRAVAAAIRAGEWPEVLDAWPAGWWEVTRAVLPATRTDSIVAGQLGVRAVADNDMKSLPRRRRRTFVLDSPGTVLRPLPVAG